MLLRRRSMFGCKLTVQNFMEVVWTVFERIEIFIERSGEKKRHDCISSQKFFTTPKKSKKSKQAGTTPSRRHIQGSKIAKRLPSVKYSFTVLEKRNFLKKNFSKKLHTQKNGPSGAPGLASASPWRAKVSQCRKTERGDPLRFFNIHSVAKHEKLKKTKIFILGKKSHNAEKKLKGGTLWNFSTSILSQNIKKNAGGTLWGKFFFEKKVSQCRKK